MDRLNHFETPVGIDPTAVPTFVQHVAAFKQNLEHLRELVSASQVLSEQRGDDGTSRAAQPASFATAKAAAEEHCFRAVVDLRDAARKLNDHNWERSLALLDKAAECDKAFFVPSQKPLSMFAPTTWCKCFSEWWFEDGLPNDQQRPRKITFEMLFAALLHRDELEYHLDDDPAPYRARSKSKFDTPEHVCIFGDTLKRLALFKGTRAAVRRRGFQRDVQLIAKASSAHCLQALTHEALGKANTEALARDDRVSKELATALRQVLISTKDVPLTDGYKRNLRHEGHNLNVMFGCLTVFATFNYADNYSPLLFQLCNGGEVMDDIACDLSAEQPDMPSLHRMRQLIAESPRAQVQFFKLMDDIVDIYFMGINGSFVGRHHVPLLFNHTLQEDCFASTCTPSLGGFGIAELEPFESQGRGFQHGHRKVYKILATRVHEVVRLFRERDPAVLQSLLQQLRQALISCAESLQYEASTLPAVQMKQNVLPEKFTQKQQIQSRLDGGLELDDSRRQLLETTPQELPGHHVREHRRAHAEQRPPLSCYSQVSLQGCHQSLMPTYRLPQSVCNVIPLDEVGMTSDTPQVEVPAKPLCWVTDDETDRIVGFAHRPVGYNNAEQPGALVPDDDTSAEQPVNLQDYVGDGKSFGLSYCRDFRALHQLNHDHDCTSTCIKYVQKKCKDAAEEALRRGRVVACRFAFFHIVVFMFMLRGQEVAKRIRRRGKKLVETAYVANTNDHNEFGKVGVVRHTPFRSATTDVGQVWGRCNIDFQFMPRTLDPDQFFTTTNELPLVPQTDPNLALAMYGVRLQLPDAPLLRRCFHSIVAMHQAAHNCDFYITKYQGKPMEQLQGLLTHLALGLRRLEAEDEADTQTSAEERARKTTLRIATAANRCSWCSVCELACYITTGGLARKTNTPVAVCLSRPMFMLQECRRILQRGGEIVLEAPDLSHDDARDVDMLCFVAAPSSSNAAQLPVSDPDLGGEEAVAADSEVDPLHDDTLTPAQHPEPLGDPDQRDTSASEVEDLEDTITITTLTNTTNLHEDWLHRGPFLVDLDLHTYVAHVIRSPRPVKARLDDAQRIEHVFAFNDHYELAKSHWQELKTNGRCVLPMLEALRCPPPDLNKGEDNAVYKTLLGTLVACQGKSRCNDPLLYRPAFFPPAAVLNDLQAAFSCRQQWKARRAEIEVLAMRAEEKCNAAKRIPVIADTILCRTHTSGTRTAPPLDLLRCLSQWWIQRCGRALPCFAPCILAFLNAPLYHEHQLTVAEYSAYQLRSVILNLDGLTIARTTKLTTGSKEHAEDEIFEAPTDAANGIQTEFHGGEGVDPGEPEDEVVDAAERSSQLFGALDVKQLNAILGRHRELEAANRPGRKSHEQKQMKAFDELFHTVLHNSSPKNDVKLAEVQRSYGSSSAVLAAALDMQAAIMKHMKRSTTIQGDAPTDDTDPTILDAMLHNLQRHQPECEWVDLNDAMSGPAHVAKMLVRRCEKRRSTAARPYKVNEEQLQCIALFVSRLEPAFQERPDPSQPWIHPARVLMTIIMDGGGGCGKTTLST